MTFREKLEKKWSEGKFVCVGLDSDFGKIPECAHQESRRSRMEVSVEDTVVAFNRKIVEATKDLVCAYKPNIAFYLAHGSIGVNILRRTIQHIADAAPEVAVILDAKVADIGNTNLGYVKMAFEYFKADAITVHPYLGAEALQPFLDRKDKGIIVLCKTSNPGSDEFQDCEVRERMYHGFMTHHNCKMHEYVATHVARHWNGNNNCAVVVGATYPEELAKVRAIVGDMPILIPGIGAQGGDIEATVKAGKDSRGMGMIINSSRGIIYASNGRDFAEAAARETQKLHNAIKLYRA